MLAQGIVRGKDGLWLYVNRCRAKRPQSLTNFRGRPYHGASLAAGAWTYCSSKPVGDSRIAASQAGSGGDGREEVGALEDREGLRDEAPRMGLCSAGCGSAAIGRVSVLAAPWAVLSCLGPALVV